MAMYSSPLNDSGNFVAYISQAGREKSVDIYELDLRHKDTQEAILIFRATMLPNDRVDPKWMMFQNEHNLILETKKKKKEAELQAKKSKPKKVKSEPTVVCMSLNDTHCQVYQMAPLVQQMIMGSVWQELKRKCVNWMLFEPYALKFYLSLWDICVNNQPSNEASKLKASQFMGNNWMDATGIPEGV